MPFWIIALLILGATIALNAAMASRVKTEKRKAPSLGDFQVPTAQENREQSVTVGTIRQTAPNCTWDGDLLTVPIKKKVPNPVFFGLVKKTVETGQYRSFFGMKLDLGQGEGGVRLKQFQIDGKIVWEGDILQGTFAFDKSDLFGGEEKEGGYAGTIDYYGGSWTQVFNAYLESQLQKVGKKARNCKGNNYLIWRGPSSGKVSPQTPNGYVGTTTNLRPFSFVLQRFPVRLTALYSIINLDDANPIHWAFELLTNADYGAGLPETEIDKPAFLAAAQTVFNENLGCSDNWDTDRPLEDMLNDINELIDGAIFVDRTTGLWTCKLARADYNIADLHIFSDSSGVTEEIEFSTNTGKDAPSEIIIPFVDKSQNFKTRESNFKDLATRRNQAAPNQLKKEIYGVSNGEQAARLCFREARVFASNLRKVTFQADRTAHFVRPFTVFRYQRKDLETGALIDVVFRALRVDDGEFESGDIEIEALEDVFSLGTLSYAPPPQTGWQPTNGAAVALTKTFLGEQPYFLSNGAARLWAFASQENGAQRNFNLLAKGAGDSSYILQAQNSDFAPVGTISTLYARTIAVDNSDSLVVAITAGLFRLSNSSAAEIRATGANLFLFADTGEICAFETFTDNGNGTATLHNVWRGLYDTAIENHLSGARVWFFSYGQALAENSSAAGNINAKIVSNAMRGAFDAEAAAAINYTVTNRAARPLPPVAVTIGNVANPTAIPAAGANIEFAWKTRNRLTQTEIRPQTDASITNETGARIGIKIYNANGVLLATREGLTGTSFSYTPLMQAEDATAAELALSFVIYSKSGDVGSFQAVRFNTARPTGIAAIILPAYNSAGTPPAGSDSPNSIGGLPIIGTPTANNQTLVTDGNGNLVWSSGGGLTVEQIQDMLSTFLVSAAGIAIDYNDVGNELVVSSTINAEFIDDRIAQLLRNGVGIQLDYNDAGNLLTISGSVGTTLEDVQDNFGNSFLNAIDGITKLYDDANNLLTLSVDSAYIKNLISAYLQQGAGVTLTQKSNSLVISQNTNSLFRVKGARRTVSETTGLLADNNVGLITLPTGAEFILHQIQTSAAANVRFYETAAARDADYNVARTVTPVTGVSGLIFETETEAANLIWNVAPKVRGKNKDAAARNEIYAAIKNVSGAPAAVTVLATVSRVLEGGLQTRVFSTGILADNATETGVVNLAKAFELKIASVSAGCRLRLYESIAARDADLNRAANVGATGEHGIIAEFVFDATLLTIPTNPVIEGGSLDAPPTAQIAYALQNLSGAAASITANFSFEEIEI